MCDDVAGECRLRGTSKCNDVAGNVGLEEASMCAGVARVEIEAGANVVAPLDRIRSDMDPGDDDRSISKLPTV